MDRDDMPQRTLLTVAVTAVSEVLRDPTLYRRCRWRCGAWSSGPFDG